MASDILDRVAMVITDIGTGDVTANVLISNRFNTPAEAGAVNGRSYWWMLEEGTDYQIFEGVYTASGTKVARTVTWQSKIAGVHGAANMSLGGNATLRSITPAEALIGLTRGAAFLAYLSANQTISSSTFTKVAFDAVAFDARSDFDATNRRFQPKIPGYYQLNMSISAYLSTAPTRLLGTFFVNGVQYNYAFDIVVTSGIATASGGVVVYLNGTTDYAEVYALITATTPVIVGTAGASIFSGALLRAA